MGVEIDVVYSGNKKCHLTHPEGATLMTDAPRDIGGDASAFSPTDLVASGLASCILTTMAMYAERHEIDLTGAQAKVVKEMSVTAPRRIARLPVVVTLSASVREEFRERLEKVAHTCPVHASLHPEIDAPIEFRYEL
ncbi:MAG: OsmC family protein [Capsulimonadales bacterium]|nr:OsmC family protein [Capsulimonadales bacterium]